MDKEVVFKYMEEQKRLRVARSIEVTSVDGCCSGLTIKQFGKVHTRQKSTFAKGKSFSHTRLWSFRD